MLCQTRSNIILGHLDLFRKQSSCILQHISLCLRANCREHWPVGSRRSGVQGFRRSGVQGVRGSGSQGFRESGVQGFKGRGVDGGEWGISSLQGECTPHHTRRCSRLVRLRDREEERPEALQHTPLVQPAADESIHELPSYQNSNTSTKH